MVLLDERDWRYLHLNGSAALLWRSLAEGCTRDQLIATLEGEYDLDTARAEADVGAFLTSLADRELVVEV